MAENKFNFYLFYNKFSFSKKINYLFFNFIKTNFYYLYNKRFYTSQSLNFIIFFSNCYFYKNKFLFYNYKIYSFNKNSFFIINLISC